MTHTPDITRPPKDLIDALREIGARDRCRHAWPHGLPQSAHGRSGGAEPRQVDRRAGADAAIPAAAAGPASARVNMPIRRRSCTGTCSTTRRRAMWSWSTRAAT